MVVEILLFVSIILIVNSCQSDQLNAIKIQYSKAN